MSTPEVLEPAANEEEVQMAKVAQRCLMAALDHSRASRIALVDEKGASNDPPVLELPPAALKTLARILGFMAQQQPVLLVPQKHELTTQEAAALLNVSRPFVVKEIEAGRLKCRKVNRHRRIEFSELMRYKAEQQKQSETALQELTGLSQEMGLEN